MQNNWKHFVTKTCDIDDEMQLIPLGIKCFASMSDNISSINDNLFGR